MKAKILIAIVYSLLFSVYAYSQMSWQPTNSLKDYVVSSFLSHGDTLYAGFLGAGIHYTVDEGETWEKCYEGITNPIVNTIIRKGGALFAGTLGGGVFKSEDFGNSWTEANDSTLNKRVWSLAVKGNTLFAGTDHGIYLSNDQGESWQKPTLPHPKAPHQIIFSLLVTGNKIIAGSSGHIYLSDDQGKTWERIALDTRFEIQSLLSDQNHIYAGSSGNGVFMSSNGRSWRSVLNRNGQKRHANAHALLFTDTTLTVGAAIQGVLKDDRELNEGFEEPQVRSLTYHKGKLYAGTFSRGVWKYDHPEEPDLAEMNLSSDAAPVRFSVFPNPVEQQTVTLQYYLPEDEHVEITLFNSGGMRLKDIVNAYQAEGSYTTSHEIGELAGGTYYFSFKTKTGVQTRQIIVIER